MDGDRLAKLGDAVDVASAKGARSTLVLMKGVAFVVAPQTRTVVTVIPEERMKENVFTSIDSAVVVDR
jgi:flagellar operon protein